MNLWQEHGKRVVYMIEVLYSVSIPQMKPQSYRTHFDMFICRCMRNKYITFIFVYYLCMQYLNSDNENH